MYKAILLLIALIGMTAINGKNNVRQLLTHQDQTEQVYTSEGHVGARVMANANQFDPSQWIIIPPINTQSESGEIQLRHKGENHFNLQKLLKLVGQQLMER